MIVGNTDGRRGISTWWLKAQVGSDHLEKMCRVIRDMIQPTIEEYLLSKRKHNKGRLRRPLFLHIKAENVKQSGITNSQILQALL